MNALARIGGKNDDKIFDIFRQGVGIEAGSGPSGMFFLRCIFWLGIVYASMSWPAGTFTPPSSRVQDVGRRVMALGGAEAQNLAATTTARVAALCDHHRVACLDDAARLTSLIIASDDPDAAVPPAHNRSGVALSAPNPRRAGRGVKLVETP